ncbi:hypothetical protein jhhlp_006588 [Lomentospora prolificans]|uniref:Ubiquitin interaction domain-containing protein n=1 Tax=Lomentospora prolificans TaxID=41688 RepID=A0A2N3N6C3_9PEZI|nr:hypothetical protein jhhlp_006588 [Lomentospora prolificans]
MSREPTDADIRSFLEFAGLSEDDRPLATRALRQPNADVSQLVMEFYDDEVAFRKKHSWDETVFTANRDGSDAPMSFHIESAPEHGSPQILQGVVPGQETPYYGAAPSRPPTPTKRRSPLGRAIDLTVADLPGPSTADEEDEDLKRALMESATEAGLDAPPQVSGVMGDYERPLFGPATRNQYDEDQWALVRQENASRNTPSLNVYPSSRKRDANTPVLLLNDSNNMDHRIGSILTILNEVPLARNTLLQIGSPATSYGHNSEWWTGKPILPPHVLAALQESGGNADAPEHAVALDHELHRLFGFLDSSERSYGSTRVLAEMFQGTWDYEESLFRALFDRYGLDNLEPFVHEACIFDIGPALSVAKEEDCEHNTVGFLKFGLTEETHKHVKSLYDVWDYELWRPALVDYLYTPLEKIHMSLFSTARDIIIVTVTDPFQSSKFSIPEVFYPERYIWQRRKEAIGLQYMRRRIRQKREKIERRGCPPGQPSLEEQMKRWEAEAKRTEILMDYLEISARFRVFKESGFDHKLYPRGAEDAPCTFSEEQEGERQRLLKVRKRAERETERLKKELEQIVTLKQKCIDAEAFIAYPLTNPDQEGASQMISKRYTLRGIGTAKDIVYVCRRAEPTLIDISDSPLPQDQWWRLEYNASHQTPVKAERVDFETVHKLMWDESNSLTLVYASDDAMNTPRIALPEGLQRFIKADNRSFQKEIEQEEAAAANSDLPMETLESFDLQPRPRSGSVDSMATNRASLGSMDSYEGYFDKDSYMPPSGMDVDLGSNPNRSLEERGEGIHSSGVESPILGHGERPFSPSLIRNGDGASPLPPPAQSSDDDEPTGMQEMKEVSTKPIFVADQKQNQERGSQLPDQN